MPASASPPVAAVELDAVSFGYVSVPVLHEVSLRVDEGEFVAVVGDNGSGKSTLLRLSLGLLRADAGTVRLFGVDPPSFREWWRVGYVPQRAATSSALPLSVEEVVRTGLAGTSRARRRAAASRDRFDHVMELMGLDGARRRRLSELSGGQQQRALIARALITAPRLLFLDEPTTGVDAPARTILRESLEHLVGVEGMAVVYVSHDPGGFTGLAHRVVEVEAGRLRTASPGAAASGDHQVAGAR